MENNQIGFCKPKAHINWRSFSQPESSRWFFSKSGLREEFPGSNNLFYPATSNHHFFFNLAWLAWSVFPTLLCARRWNSVEIEFQNPSLAARPRLSASLIISVNLLIKMSCKRFPSFHSDHYQHARPPAEYRSFSPLPALHTFQRSSTFDATRPKKWKISNAPKSSEPAQLSESVLKMWGIKR